MSDEELKGYIPQYGDRLAARYFISQRKVSRSDGSGLRSSVASGSSSTVLDRLRRKLNVDSMSSSSPFVADGVGEKSLLGLTRVARCLDRNKTAGNEVMRAIEVGWLHTQTFDGQYRIVKAKDGGGIRKLCLPQQTIAHSILLHAKNFFFPQGKSKFGLLEEFLCCLCNFNEQEMNEKEISSTIAELYDLHKLSRLRFFIRTCPPCIPDWSSDDDFVSPKPRSSSVRMAADVNSFMDSMDQVSFLPDLQTCESSPSSVISCSNTHSVAISDSSIISTVSHNVTGSWESLDSVISSTASHSATRSLASSDSVTTSANSCSASWLEPLDDHTADSETQLDSSQLEMQVTR
jgi:hypothetical protein